jgi:hypothetical protein
MKKERVMKNLVNKTLSTTAGDWNIGEYVDLGKIVDGITALVHGDGENYGCDLFDHHYPVANIYGYGATPCGAVMNALDQLVGLDVLEKELI